jgi:hypothetical protein
LSLSLTRKFTGGDGSDTTAAVLSLLRSGRQFQFADLILIGELTDSDALFLTSWNSPLAYPVQGTFNPANFSRGKVESKIGVTVASLDFHWRPQITQFTKTIGTANPYQLAQLGQYDNKKFRLWRAVMPTPGDANTLGACEYFGGWVSKSSIQRGEIVFTIDSFLNVLNQKVPIATIQSTSIIPGFTGATPVLVDGETDVPVFEAVAGSNETIILATALSPSAGKIYGNNKLRYGYVYFLADSSLAGVWSAIGANSDFNAHGGVHYNYIQIYSPLPWPPAPGDKFFVSTQKSPLQSPGSFIYVPAPEQAI